MARIQANIELGWSPILAVASTGTSRVLEVVGWQGGFGSAPSTGLFVGSNGYVANITDGVNIAGGGGGGGGSINFSAGTTSSSLSAVTFNNGGGVTFGLDTGANAGIITASVFTGYLTTAAQSNQVVNSLNGSTGQISLNVGSSLSSSTNGSSITFGLASNITTALQSAGNYLTTADLSQNSSKYVQNWKLTGNTSGTTSSAQGTDLWLSGGNGVTISGSSNSIVLSVATNYQSQGAYLTTAMQSNAATISNINISGGTTSSNLSNFKLIDSNGVSWSLDTGSKVYATVKTNYAGTGTTFNGANISGSITQDTNGLQLSLSVVPPSGITNINVSGGTTSSNLSNFKLIDSNGVSWSLDTGSKIYATVKTDYQTSGNYLTTADLSQNSSNYFRNWKLTGNTAGTTSSQQGTDFWLAGGNGVTVSGSSNTISFSVATNYQSQGAYLTNINISGGTTSSNLSNFKLIDSNGVSWSLDTGSKVYATVQTNYAGTGTTFNGANISGSITQNTAGIQLSLSVAAPGGGAAVNISAGTTSNNLQSLVFANSNGVTFGLNTGASSQSITASVAAQSNQTIEFFATGGTTNNTTATFNATSILMNFQGAMTGGFSNGSFQVSAPSVSSLSGTGMVSIVTNGSTISIGAAETPKSYYANIEQMSNLSNLSVGGSSVYVQPFILPYDISFSFVRIPMSLSLGSGTFSTTANTTIGISQSVTYFVNIYSLGTGANSRSLQYVTGSSITNGLNITGQIGAASNNQTVGQTMTYNQASGAGTASFSATYNVNAASINFSTTGLTSFNGLRWFDMPLPGSLSGGAYWLGIQRSTTQSTSGTAGMSTLGLTKFDMYLLQANSNFAPWGISSNASTDGYYLGLGQWSTNSNGATSSSMGLASISTSSSQPLLPFQLIQQS